MINTKFTILTKENNYIENMFLILQMVIFL